MTRAFRILISALAVIGVLSPLGRDVLVDGFPLSTYPMFISDRSTAKLYNAVGFRDEQSVRLPGRVIAGDDEEPMLAAQTLELAIKRSKKARKQLCREIAQAVAQDPEFKDLERVELRLELHDPIAYFTESPAPPPQTIKRRTSCRVDQGAHE